MENSSAASLEPLAALSVSSTAQEGLQEASQSSPGRVVSYWQHRSVLCIEELPSGLPRQPQTASEPQDWIWFPVPRHLRQAGRS
jgi:hypothetical protein